MTQSSMALSARRWHWIPAIFVAGFAVIISVNAALIFYATTTFSGLETEHAYERGLDYNETLKEAAHVAALGWTAHLTTLSTSAQQTIVLELLDRNGHSVSGLEIIAELIRPTDSRLDQTLTMTEVAPGRYSAEFVPGAPGQWDLRLAATQGSAQWQYAQRIILR